MDSFLDDLMAMDPGTRREAARARLRVDVAERLLLRMEALPMTKAQLAAALGVSRSAVGQALTGSRNMSLNLLADIAAALGLNPRLALEVTAAADRGPPRLAEATSEPAPGFRTASNAGQRAITLEIHPSDAMAAIPVASSSTAQMQPDPANRH